MSHTDPMILALRALGEPAGTATDAEHALTCAHCRQELARLTDVVDLARSSGPVEPLEQPPAAVWDRIAAAVGTAPAIAMNGTATRTGTPTEDRSATENNTAVRNGTATEDSTATGTGTATENGTAAGNGNRGSAADSAPGTVHPRHRGRRGIRARGRLTTALAGVAAGLIIGVGATTGIVQLTRAPATHVVAQIELSPLPAFPQWQGATGTAVMRATGTQQVMAVTLHAPARPGFYEVWLLARNGVSMISLGDLNADKTGTFTLPPGVDLRNYSRVDVSLQPFDGSTVHSKTSVVRGSLPAVALGADAAG